MPDRIPIAGARLNIEGSLRCPQSGQTHTGFLCPLSDHGVRLRPGTEHAAEEPPGTPIEHIAPIDKGTQSHRCAPFGNHAQRRGSYCIPIDFRYSMPIIRQVVSGLHKSSATLLRLGPPITNRYGPSLLRWGTISMSCNVLGPSAEPRQVSPALGRFCSYCRSHLLHLARHPS